MRSRQGDGVGDHDSIQSARAEDDWGEEDKKKWYENECWQKEEIKKQWVPIVPETIHETERKLLQIDLRRSYEVWPLYKF